MLQRMNVWASGLKISTAEVIFHHWQIFQCKKIVDNRVLIEPYVNIMLT